MPLNKTNRDRLLSAILDIAADPERQDLITGHLWELSQIDDPRAFESIVKIYKNDKLPEGKKQIVYALGTSGQENVLPILLDYCFRQIGELSDDETKLLEQYPVSTKNDPAHTMDADDRDKVGARFIQYLQNNNDYDDFLRQAMAYTLAILYLSDITSFRSKEMIQANANISVCYGYDEYIDGPVGYIYLKEFMNFGEDTK